MAVETFQLNGNKPTILKDPDAVLDYTLRLGVWLENESDTLVSVETEIVCAAGNEITAVQVDSAVIQGQNILVWVSGGTRGVTEGVTIRFTTAAGRTDDRTLWFRVREK